MKRTAMPRDMNQRAKAVLDLATGEREATPEVDKHSPSVELGRLGGLKGGPARAAKLTPERRREIARRAAGARWRS